MTKITNQDFFKYLHLSLGFLSLGLGILGGFLPILPTTPFILLAAFFFSKSSKHWHQKLLNNRLFGPIISDWQQKGAISKKAKISSSLAIIVIFSLTLYNTQLSLTYQVLLVLIGSAVLTFILTRPGSD